MQNNALQKILQPPERLVTAGQIPSGKNNMRRESKITGILSRALTSAFRSCRPVAVALTAILAISAFQSDLPANQSINFDYGVQSFQPVNAQMRTEVKKHGYLSIYPLNKANYSTNWSGYISEDDFAHPKSVYTSIIGTWKVHGIWKGCDTMPGKNNVHASSYTSVQWVGISGANGTGNLIQIGTEEDYGNTKIKYNAWYEMLPAYSVTIPRSKIDPSPGDTISSRISLVNQKKHIWNIEIIDVTKNQGFSKTVRYVTSRQSAEWVEEVQELYNVENGIAIPIPSLLAGFGRDQFIYSGPTEGNYAGINGHIHPISNLPHHAMDLVEYSKGRDKKQYQEVRAATSRLGHSGKSFDIYYMDCSSMRRP